MIRPGVPGMVSARFGIALVALLIVSGSAEAQKNCTKGIPCGNTCISADKVCHVGAGTGSSASTQPRDEKGRFVRSSSARARFMRLTGYPSGRPGYVVDHIIPLACGGPDAPENMQWQTIEEAKEKDKVERKECSNILR
jgi:hypothetical protein